MILLSNQRLMPFSRKAGSRAGKKKVKDSKVKPKAGVSAGSRRGGKDDKEMRVKLTPSVRSMKPISSEKYLEEAIKIAKLNVKDMDFPSWSNEYEGSGVSKQKHMLAEKYFALGGVLSAGCDSTDENVVEYIHKFIDKTDEDEDPEILHEKVVKIFGMGIVSPDMRLRNKVNSFINRYSSKKLPGSGGKKSKTKKGKGIEESEVPKGALAALLSGLNIKVL